MKRASLRLAIALVGALLTAAAPARPEAEPAAATDSPLLPVPRPALDRFEPAVREQLEAERRAVDTLLEAEGPPGSELARALAELGRLYVLYDLAEPAEACLRNARALMPGDFRWPHYLGYLYALAGRFEEARAQFDAALERRPDYAPALARRGQAELELSDFAAARRSLERALELLPDSAAVRYGLGRVAFAEKDFETAAGHFEAALEAQPEAGPIHYQLGLTYRELGDLERARSHLGRRGGAAPALDDPLIDGLASFVTGSKVRFQAGIQAARDGEFARAAEEFAAALEIEPEDYLAHYNLALAQLAEGRRQEAIASFERSLEINGRFRNAHFNLGTLAAAEGRFEDAARHFEAAHELDPEDLAAHLEWATALAWLGRSAQARQELEAVLRLDPGNGRALLNLGLLAATAGDGDEAARRWREALDPEVEPEVRAEAHARLADLASRAGDATAALEHFRAAVELAPEAVEPHYGLAAALGRAGRFREAAEAYAEVVRREPAAMGAHFGRAMALVLADDFAAARQALERGLEIDPEARPLRHLLARLLATCPEEPLRDGERALGLALAVFEEEQIAEHAETVAMALAELGRFDEAVEWQRQVIGQAGSDADPGHLAAARRRLALYEAGRPVRAPWRVSG